MTKQKRSFFEKITGIQKVDGNAGSFGASQGQGGYPNDQNYFPSIEQEDDVYEFPQVANQNPAQNISFNDDDYYQDQGLPIINPQQQQQTTTPAPIQPAAPPPPPPPAPEPQPAPVPQSQSYQQDDDTETDQDIESEGQLTIDVYQTDEHIVIKSTIAGVKPEDLDVNINNDMVTIRGERKQDEEVDAESYYYQECYWGPFSRSVILPVEIIPEKAEANMKNGILGIKLLKADTTKTRKIQVKGF